MEPIWEINVKQLVSVLRNPLHEIREALSLLTTKAAFEQGEKVMLNGTYLNIYFIG